MQLEAVHQEVGNLKVRLSATQTMLEAVKKEIDLHLPKILNIKLVNSKLQFPYFAKDDALISTQDEVNEQLKNEKIS